MHDKHLNYVVKQLRVGLKSYICGEIHGGFISSQYNK